MDAFSLLKYWKGETGGGSRAAAETTTVVTDVDHKIVKTDDEDGDDNGPFFDLEFATAVTEEDEKGESDCTDDDVFNFTTISSSGSGSRNSIKDRNLSLSLSPHPPPDDLIFNGDLVVPLDSSSLSLFNSSSESNTKNQLPLSILKSATRFRVFMLRFKKSRSERGESNESTASATKSEHQKPQEGKEKETQEFQQNQKEQSKFFTVKLKVEEVVPVVSLFTRDNSSRISSSNGGSDRKPKKPISTVVDESVSDERRFSKDVLMMKYLKMVKPLYVRASRRNYGGGGGGKQRISGETAVKYSPAAGLVEDEEPKATGGNVKNLRNIPAGLRVVCKRLGKSQSAFATVAVTEGADVSKRRDDSLLEQEDGIRSAILHCKRSFNGFTGESGNRDLSTSSSESSHEKSMELSRKSPEELVAEAAMN